MNRQEVAKLVTMADAAFPGKLTAERVPLTVEVWAAALADIPAPLAEAAFLTYVRTATFFPAVGEIRAIAIEQARIFPTPDEAWAWTRTYFRRSSRRGTIPAIVNDTASLVGGWNWLGQQDENDTRVADQFRKAYTTLLEQRLRTTDIAEAIALTGGTQGVTMPSPASPSLPRSSGTTEEEPNR